MFKKITIYFALSIFLTYFGLIVSLLYFWDTHKFFSSLFSERTLFSVKMSILAATIATLISVVVAIPAAYALSRFEFTGKDIIDTTLEIPMIVSPAALGAMLLIFFNNPIGIWIQNNHIKFVFTQYGIILAQFITILGVSTRLIKASMDEIPKRYEDVSHSLGVTPLVTFFKVTIPLCKNGILAAIVLSWAKAIGEFGATITIAGSMAMKTETLPIAIFMRLATADIEGTVVLIFILFTIGFSTLYGVRLFVRRNSVL